VKNCEAELFLNSPKPAVEKFPLPLAADESAHYYIWRIAVCIAFINVGRENHLPSKLLVLNP